jgi:stage IV sporulation protein B
MPFGVHFSTQGVMVIGYGSDKDKSSNPGYMSGIRPSDIITKINGTAVNDISALTKMVDSAKGKSLSFTCRRNGKEFETSITPYYSASENRYKTGLLVRDSGAGIGTVTYIIPESNLFGGLGHGICDGETGSLIPLQRGVVSDVTINGVIKGISGTPGELRGSFKNNKIGSVINNTSCGIFGMFSELPKQHGELMPIALRNEIKAGKAYIYCTLDETGPQKYEIQISEIDTGAKGNKCFTVKVTDPCLIEKTGGIVQGMSGSPIIQDGKIVGAVTHVLINDPTTGYGIFIENMLTQMGDMIR